MAFRGDTVLETSKGLGSGELIPEMNGLVLPFDDFKDGLIQGRFCRYDAGSIDNLDGTATPNISGITRRLLTGETGVETYRNTGDIINSVAEVITTGFATVDVVDGQNPAKYGTAYAVNAAGSGANFGKATTVTTDNVDSGWVFWEQQAANVWLVARKELV